LVGSGSMTEKVNLLSLFWKFFKIGAFTCGGGYAMIPLIEKEVVGNKWIKKEDIVDLIAISQSIPGAVAVNMSLFVGYRVARKKGAIVAVLGCILPSILIIITIATFMKNIEDQAIVKNAFTGILAGVVALILLAAYRIAKIAVLDLTTLFITLITITLLTLTSINTISQFVPNVIEQFLPIMLILSGGLTGLLFYYIFPKKVRKIMNSNGGRK